MRVASLLLAVTASSLIVACSDATSPIATAPSVTGPLLSIGHNLGFTYATCTTSPSDDVDQDGLSDYCERELAFAFSPQMMLDQNDPSSFGNEPYYAVRRIGPSSGEVSIIYLLAYHEDTGVKYSWAGLFPIRLTDHSGDSEFVRLIVREEGGVWQVRSAFLSAHYKAKFLGHNFDESGEYGSSQLQYLEGYPGAIPIVYVSREKHANYPSWAACSDADDDCNGSFYGVRVLTRGAADRRNIGSSTVQLIDCTRSESSYYGGTECFWSHVRRFNGWHTRVWGGGSKPYHHVLYDFGFAGQVAPELPTVSINGQMQVHSGSNCAWSANIWGGTPPYEIAWYRNDQLVGTEASYQTNVGSETFQLTVIIWDAKGYTSEAVDFVVVQDSNPYCAE